MQAIETVEMPLNWVEKLTELELNENTLVDKDQLNTVRCAASRMHRRTAIRFAVRTGKDGTIRVWRIK